MAPRRLLVAGSFCAAGCRRVVPSREAPLGRQSPGVLPRVGSYRGARRDGTRFHPPRAGRAIDIVSSTARERVLRAQAAPIRVRRGRCRSRFVHRLRLRDGAPRRRSLHGEQHRARGEGRSRRVRQSAQEPRSDLSRGRRCSISRCRGSPWPGSASRRSRAFG